jgi:hypothetical protein
VTTVDEHLRRWLLERQRERAADEIPQRAAEAGMIPGGPVPGYPPGYRDPDWDGTEEGFQVVVQARADALATTMSAFLPDNLEFACATGILQRIFGGDPEQPGPPYAHVYDPTAADRPADRQTVTAPEPMTLAAAAADGDSHVWLSDPLPATCDQVTIGSEAHHLDQSMIRSHDGPGRHAVWLETTLRRPWPFGTEVTAG